MVKIAEADKNFPVKRRIISALTMCALLLVVTVRWPFEPAKVIAIIAATVGRFFEIKGRWFMLFMGIVLGDMLLYVWR